MDVSAPTMRPYGRHVLICEHGDCADAELARRLQQRFHELARPLGLTKLRNPQRVKCSLSGCLGVCQGGPIVVVYPDGIWYHHVDEALFERIINEHVVGGCPIEEHIFHRLGAPISGPLELPAIEAGPDAAVSGQEENTPSSSAQNGISQYPESGPPMLSVSTVESSSLSEQIVVPRPGSNAEADARRKAARANRKQKGLIIVNTGTGKGKTTAALGVLLRSRGRKLRIGGIQFLKHENANFGELRALRELGVELTPMGDGWTWTSRDLDETQAKALHGWEVAKQKITSGDYDVFLLDEFTYLLSYGWLQPQPTIDWIVANKPPMLHLIITGRYAPEPLIEAADLVTEMREIKHPFRDQGIRGQKGIEF